MMICTENKILGVLFSLLLAGYASEASPYNYSASIECKISPSAPQYRGGIVVNPEFDDGLEGWNVFGGGKIEVRTSETGNKFIVAYDRTHLNDSFSQSMYFEEGVLHSSFSAWVQVNEGSDNVIVALRTLHIEKLILGSVKAQSGCWSMLKGGFSVNLTTPAELHFESENSSIEIWVDNVSLQPFTKRQWRDQQLKNIQKIRKRKVIIHVADKKGKKLQGAEIGIEQKKPYFPLGCALTYAIIKHKAYQNWFISRFSHTATSFDNEMKWYWTEKKSGQENYTAPDAMVAFAKHHGLLVRGHNIFWDDPYYNMKWVKSLSPRDLLAASVRRMGSVMARYSGQLMGWDVMNENLHHSYFEDRIGPNASAMFFKVAQALDSEAVMFLNEFNTLENSEDMKSTPSKYLEKIRYIRSFKGNEEMVVGIGLQAHFDRYEPNIAYMRACLDVLGATNMPIWLTELDVKRCPNQADYLEEIMREAYSHPAVQGIIVFAGWKPTNCNDTCLNNKYYNDTLPSGCANLCLHDSRFNNLPAGDVVDKLIEEWKSKKLRGETDKNGVFQHSIFHGEYLVKILNPVTGRNMTKLMKVTSEKSEPLDVWFSI